MIGTFWYTPLPEKQTYPKKRGGGYDFNFEMTLRYECKYIIMTNPTNKNLTNNLLPLWTGKELTKLETLELLEEVEGKTEKGKLFLLSNKNTVVLKTKVMNNFRFPITSKDHLNHRINEINNIEKIKVKLHG